MAKFKAKTRDCQLIVKAKLQFSEVIDKREYDIFANKYFRGFLKPQKIKGKTIEYIGPVAVSLFERLKKPISKYDFFFILEQVVVATQKLQKSTLPLNKVVWDIRHVYINTTTKEVKFIYLPIQNTATIADINGFIDTIIYSAKPADEHDNDFVSRFVYYFKGLSQYDSAKIEAFISREDRSIVNTIKKQTTGGSGFITDKPKDYYDHYEQNGPNDDEATGLLDDEDATGLLAEEDEDTGLLNESESEATGLLQDDEENTGLLVEESDDDTGLLIEDNVHYPRLYRVLTNEYININKPVFRLGKERSYVDYFVTNNNAVSRSHADIITRGGRYFVLDLNSKNKTYINGQVLPAQCECEICAGNRLSLGNEEFIFNA